MAEAPAAARSPLAGHAADLAAAGGLEVAFLAQLELRADPALAAPRTRVVALPLEPNTWVTSGGLEALWLGPDGWLLVGAPGAAPALARQLGEDLDGLPHAVVDVSAQRAVVDLAGPGRFELLAEGCSLDLHPRSWGAGRCAQTLLWRMPVILQERQGATRLFVRQSLAAHLAAWLSATRPRS